MAKLILKYEAAVLREIPLTVASFTIGRVPGNALVIDNLAVSSQHAKISFETDKFVLEDLNSLNGTFVNNQRTRKTFLKNGDQVVIGKHTLVFQDEGGPRPRQLEAAEAGAASVAKLEETVQWKLDAIAEYREAIRLTPNLVVAHGNLAVALYQVGEFSKAWQAVHEVRRLGGNVDPGFLTALREKMPEPD